MPANGIHIGQLIDIIHGRTPHADEFWAHLQRNIAKAAPSSFARLITLENDLHVFHRSVGILKLWGERTFPGIFFRDGSLPSNPINARLRFSPDPVSSYLRGRWRLDWDTPPPDRLLMEQDVEGAPVEIELEHAIDIFSDRFTSAVQAASTSPLQIIRFTVNSINNGYRILVSDRWWNNPLPFGRSFSTPVVGNLAADTYKIGGDRGDGNLVWDPVPHLVSTTNTSTLVNAF